MTKLYCPLRRLFELLGTTLIRGGFFRQRDLTLSAVCLEWFGKNTLVFGILLRRLIEILRDYVGIF